MVEHLFEVQSNHVMTRMEPKRYDISYMKKSPDAAYYTLWLYL